MNITPKEKKEIGLMLGSVFFVALIGVLLTNSAISKQSVAGEAVHLSASAPTYEGTLVLLKTQCSAVVGTGDCNAICGSDLVCVPVEENCDESLNENSCWCCRGVE